MFVTRKFFLGIGFSLIAMPLAAGTISDGYRPQNDAQRNYKACKPEAIVQGRTIVKSFCGDLPVRPKFPSYDEAWNRTSKEELNVFTEKLELFHKQVERYQTCIKTRVMGDGSLQTRTLDYAACADQGAVDDLLQSAEEWGDSCRAFVDSRVQDPAHPQSCTPPL